MAMFSLQRFGAARGRKPPSELLGLDFGGSGIKAVRLRRANGHVSLVRAACFERGDGPEITRPALPRECMAHYSALALSARRATIRILNLPAHLGGEEERRAHVREHMGLGDDHRLGFAALSAPKARAETRALAVGLPDAEARAALDLFSEGPPAPYSLEVSGLSALTAFVQGPGRRHEQAAVGVIESGACLTIMALFHNGAPVLIRKFDLGVMAVSDRVQKQLGVDAETARHILADGSFDVSQPVRDVLDPFLRQLILSREFVERREGCRIERVYLSGGMCLSRFWADEISRVGGITTECWDPFEGMTLAEGALPADLEGQRSRFTAAVGACLGAWEAA